MTAFASLTSDNALPQLRSALAAVSFSDRGISLVDFWSVFAVWVEQPIEGLDADADADLLLYETIVKRAIDGSSRTLAVSFTRQLMQLDDDGEYAGMDQILADFTYEIDDLATDTTRAVGGDQFWGKAGPRSAGWRARVETADSFVLATSRTPRSHELAQSPV